jgi:hypothetical protein
MAQAALPSLSDPAISPDGREIAFVSGGDIWTVAAAGGEAHLLVTHPARVEDTGPSRADDEMHPRPVDVEVARPRGETETGSDAQLERAVKELLAAQ